MQLWPRLAVAAAVITAGCLRSSDSKVARAWQWNLPPFIPAPLVPADNPMTLEKVELGRVLFFDTRLSGNQTQACASCHRPERAFTEDRQTSLGSTGEHHPRNAQSLANVAYASSLTWANPILTRIELQNPIPIFGEHPIEMGALGHEDRILERLRGQWLDEFRAAFPGESDPVTISNIVRALASFQRSLLFFDSPFDRFQAGDTEALSESAYRGMKLFFSERLECSHCHSGFTFSDSVAHSGTETPKRLFHNNGLYNIDGMGGYPINNTGLFEFTGRAEDMGKFRAPSLRNVAVTAPYMHDGSVDTLEELIDIYARGGRLIEEGPYAGDGAKNPYKSPFVRGFDLSPKERADLRAFLSSLTDSSFLHNSELP